MSTPFLFDVHTHVQFAAYDEDRDAVMARARDAGVWMVNVGTDPRTSRDAISLSGKYPDGVYATVGFHPTHTGDSYHDVQETGKQSGGIYEFDPRLWRSLAAHPSVVAIGECGLDYYRTKNLEMRTKQFDIFKKQIELAIEIKKPLMIHCRHAFSDLIDILSSYALGSQFSPSGVVHFFSGTKDDARGLMDLGFSFSFGGVITFARDYDEVIQYIPLDRMMLETDAPYVSPMPYRGKRNEPAHVAAVARKLAEIKGLSAEEIYVKTTSNALGVFEIKI